MIDFRYLLVTIIAVFLALAIGIGMGSGFVGEFLIEDLERNIEEVRTRNRQLQQEIRGLDRRIESDDALADAVLPPLVEGRLLGINLVLVRLPATDDGVYEAAVAAVEDAGGQVDATIALTSSFVTLDADAAASSRELLSPSAREAAGDADALQEQLALQLGEALSAAARDVTTDDALEGQARIRSFEDKGLVDVDASSTERIVPFNARFLLVSGASGDATTDVGELASGLTTSLSESSFVVAGESLNSDLGVVDSIRSAGNLRDSVWTVEGIDTPAGRYGLTLAFDSPRSARPLHLGGEDSDPLPVPEPAGSGD